MKKTLLLLLSFVAAIGLSAQANILENGDFEAWENNLPTYWKSASTASSATLSQSDVAHGGKYSVMIKNTTSNKRLAYKEMYLLPGKYTLTFWAKAASEVKASVRPGYAIVAEDNTIDSNGYNYGDFADNIEDWAEVTHEFTLEETTRVCILIYNTKSDSKKNIKWGDVLIDDVVLTSEDGGIDTSKDDSTPKDYTPTGDGSLANPYTLDDVRGLSSVSKVPTEAVWVKGTVCGSLKNNAIAETPEVSNIALGTAEAWMGVALPAESDVRAALNLVSHPELLGKDVWVYGKIQTYFGKPGVKETSSYSLDGATVGIHTATTTATQGRTYDLQGRQAKAVRGLYIHNGVKVLR
ncbi:MAG: DUF6359 domain-containing protein [Bacteroidaceae bacterium]|nr:DUF6359 domain-containing protein [Bacteroidaceae bacterium]